MTVQFTRKLSIGADPEFFLYDTKEKMYVGAHHFFPGTKEEPYKLSVGACQVDGMAAEFNIPPCTSSKNFSEAIEKTIDDMRDFVPSHIEFRFEAIVSFNEDYFKEVDDSQKVLGCDPDYSFFTNTVNPTPEIPGGQRTSSGHLHFGFIDPETNDIAHTEQYREFCSTFMRSRHFSGILGAAPDYNSRQEQLRRRYYGAFGAFRPKPYGFEYRAPSSRWVGAGPAIHRQVFHRAKTVFGNVPPN